MAAGKKLKAGAWTTGVLSACFLGLGIGGTTLGDYIIKNHLHGDSMEKHTQFCRESFAAVAKEDPDFSFTEQDVKGCAAEKARGFRSASNAHKTIRAVSWSTLGVLVPATIGMGIASRRRKNQSGPSAG